MGKPKDVEKKGLRDQIKALEEQRRAGDQALKNVQTKFKKSEKELAKWQQLVKDTQRKSSQQVARLEVLEAEHREMVVEGRLKDNERLRREVSAISRRSAGFEKDIKIKDVRIRDLEAQVSSLRDKAERTHEMVERSIEQMQTARDNAKERYAIAVREKNEFEVVATQKDKRIQELVDQLKSLEGRLRKKTEEAKAARNLEGSGKTS